MSLFLDFRQRLVYLKCVNFMELDLQHNSLPKLRQYVAVVLHPEVLSK